MLEILQTRDYDLNKFKNKVSKLLFRTNLNRLSKWEREELERVIRTGKYNYLM